MQTVSAQFCTECPLGVVAKNAITAILAFRVRPPATWQLCCLSGYGPLWGDGSPVFWLILQFFSKKWARVLTTARRLCIFDSEQMCSTSFLRYMGQGFSQSSTLTRTFGECIFGKRIK